MACYLLMRPVQPNPSPAPTLTALFPSPFAMPTLPAVSKQAVHIGAGVWYQHADRVMRRTPPPELRPGYYDTFDWRIQPDVDLSDLK